MTGNPIINYIGLSAKPKCYSIGFISAKAQPEPFVNEIISSKPVFF